MMATKMSLCLYSGLVTLSDWYVNLWETCKQGRRIERLLSHLALSAPISQKGWMLGTSRTRPEQKSVLRRHAVSGEECHGSQRSL
jgi:hypothetical protein